jgi:hypothetical protein
MPLLKWILLQLQILNTPPPFLFLQWDNPLHRHTRGKLLFSFLHKALLPQHPSLKVRGSLEALKPLLWQQRLMQEKKSDAAPWNVCSVHKNPMTFLFLQWDIRLPPWESLEPYISLQKRKGTSMESFRLHHETNYPPSKIFQSSNLPIFQSSNLPIFQSSGG